jgi:hypothetical protein
LDVSDEDVSVSPIEKIPQADDPTPPYEPPKVEPLISFYAITGHQVNWIH